MKKIILSLTIMALAVSGFSQGKYARTLGAVSSSSVYLDTNTNASQKYFYSPIMSPSSTVHSIQYVGTKLTGYVKGFVALQVAIDTTGYAAGAITNWVTVADSTTLTNQSINTRTWDVTGLRRLFRVRITTIDSTQTLEDKVNYLHN